MNLDFDICYQAISRRDDRFDGQFFTAVKTTRIFCRPICPAGTPKPENCHFYPSAEAALSHGFRPCLRCRPEAAPLSPAWKGVKTTVDRALNLIEEGALDQQTVGELAMRLGIGERYLRRLFSHHVGTSPMAVARGKRVLRAKRLITDSQNSMTDIAYASGFKSVRQFNDTFSKLYGKRPSELRKSVQAQSQITPRQPAQNQGHDNKSKKEENND